MAFGLNERSLTLTVLGSMLTVGIATAQMSPMLSSFANLSTNRDGSVLLFASALRLRGTENQSSWEKIFSWTAKDGARLLAQRPATPFSQSTVGLWDGGAYYHLRTPCISSDGQVLAFTGQNDCTWGTACAYSVNRWESTIRLTNETEIKIRGSVRLSANGRYGLAQSSVVFNPDVTWIDVLTGQSVASSRAVLVTEGPRPVANDGSTLRRAPEGLELWRPGFDPFRPTEVKLLAELRDAGRVLLSSDAKIVVAHTPSGLVLYEIETGQVRVISTSVQIEGLDVSEDGSVVLVRESSVYQIYRRSAPGLYNLRLTGSVNEAVLSGNGKVVFAVVDRSRVVRLDLESGSAQDVIPTTTYSIAQFSHDPAGTVARGSLLQISNILRTDLPQEAPLPGGPAISADFGDQQWPIIASDSNGTLVQVPWEAPMGADPNYLRLTLRSPTENSPFESAWIIPYPLKVQGVFPQWLTYSPLPFTAFALAAHDDFSTLVSPDSPARPGEVIHLYGMGFGEVTPPVRTGEPGRSNPLSRVAGDLRCALDGSPVEILFAGLAPSLIGIYQIDLRLPSSMRQIWANLECKIGSNFGLSAPLATVP